MTNKRIWIICHYATPRQYGYGTRQFLLAEEYLKLGYEVTVFASPSNYQLNKVPSLRGLFTRENINGVETVWVWGIRYSNPAGLKRVLSWFIFSFLLLFYPVPKKKLPGIIVVSSLSLVTVINGLFLKLRSPKSQFIFEIRDIWPLTLTDIGGYSPYNPLVILLGWIEKTGYRKADNIVATMPRADLHIRKRIGSDFNFTCIPQGLDLYDAGSDSELSEEERKAIFPEDGFIIGYAGAFGRSNSLDTLVKAARLINDRGIQGIHFILLGDGSEKDRLVSLAEGLGNLKFVPRMPRKKVHAFLKCCSVLHDSVLPVGLYQYGLSRNKWMDYMFSGKPIIVSYSGHVSLINEADCGLVVPACDAEKLADAVLHYYNTDLEQLETIGQRGRDFVINNRSFEKLASEYVKIFWY